MRAQFFLLALTATLLTACSKTEAPKPAPPPGTMPPPSQKQNVTFVADIKPIFDKACVDCHGPKKHKGDLRLDTAEATIQGSEHGPILEIGKSEISLMVSNIARLGIEDDWMPPVYDKHEALTLEEVALVRAWIDQGAK
jgi:hypothetical protein